MYKFTLESIAQIAFGLRLGCITQEKVGLIVDYTTLIVGYITYMCVYVCMYMYVFVCVCVL
jgi:hypothetical protein